MIVGAQRFDNGETNEGRAFVFLGSASGLVTTADWTAESNQAGALFGASVASAGDVNGDGYSDVMVGATGYSNGQNGEGRAFAYLGSAAGLATAAGWTAESNQVLGFFGWSVAGAGDVNGDGYSDVIVGALGFSNAGGRAYVYLGSASGLATTADWTAESNQDNAEFSYSVASAGDVNGDGYSDVIIGANHYSNGEHYEGRAYVYLGSASGLAAAPAWTAESNQASASFGYSVAGAGDVNADGYSDVVVGALTYSNGEANEGRTYLYLGSASGLAATAAWTTESNQANAKLGVSVAAAGNVNGDSYSDVIVGAVAGRAYVYLGSASGFATNAAWSAESNQANAGFGTSVASAGDVDGDGFSDVIVGAWVYDNGQTDEGRAFLYYGNAGPGGLSPNARQHRAGDTGPLAPLDTSGSLSGVNLQVQGRSPFGRGGVRLEYEIKPLGTLFDGSGLQRAASWVDTGTLSVPLAAAINSLAPGTGYHWRLRVLYRPSTTPFQAHGPWLTLAANGPQELDFRTEKDTDSDSIFDRLDNCTLVFNPTQLDANGDGYGNLCDADLNNTGTVTTADFAILRSVLNQSAGASVTAAAADLNGSGTVTTADFAILRAALNKAPGPSGLRP